MKSTWDLILLPDGLRVLITTVALALALAPFFPGLRIAGFEVPRLRGKARRAMRVIGPLCFAVALGAFIPAWPSAKASISDCGFYRDDYGPAGEWQRYDPTRNGKERFWVGCQITANIPLTIESVLTPGGLADSLFTGLNPQKQTDSIALSAKQTEWLAVPIERSIDPGLAARFRKESQIKFKVAGSDEWIVGELPALALPVDQ